MLQRQRRAPPLAHMVGTPEKLDATVPGSRSAGADDGDAVPSGNRRSQTPFSYPGKRQPKLGQVIVRFKEDEHTRPLRQAIVGFALAVQDSVRAARRLWLPRTSMTTKFRYYREAVEDPGRAVMLNSDMQRVLSARSLGIHKVDVSSLPPRPKPRFRTRDPGLRFIIFFNLGFVWWLMSRPL